LLRIFTNQQELPDETVTKTIITVGKKEGGKTYFEGVLEEELSKQNLPFTVIDPVGAHWGIKEKYPIVVFGGPQADVPLDSTIGADVAEITVKTGMSNIFDLQDFSKAAQRKFVADFTEKIMMINQTPRHMIYEEADLFIPQKVYSDVGRVYNEVDNLVRRGRQRGLGVSVVSQRPALLNKDTTSQGDLFVFFRLPGTQDRKAATDFLQGVANVHDIKRIYGTLPTLEKGQCILYSPEWLKMTGALGAVRKRETYHAGRTPQIGEKLGFKPTPVNVVDLLPMVKDLLGRKEKEDDELSKMRKQLDALLKENESLVERIKIRSEVKDFLGKSVKLDEEKPFHQLEDKYANELASLNAQLLDRNREVEQLRIELKELQPYVDLKDTLSRILNNRPVPVIDPTTPEIFAVWQSKLHQAPRKLLQFLIEHQGTKFTRAQLAQLTGYSASGGTFQDAISTLNRNGLIRLNGQEVSLKT
jgi:uncharacterized protein